MPEENSSAKNPAATPEKKAKARDLWERLGNSRPGPDNKDLLYLARFVPLLSSAAAKTLLGRKLSFQELRELILHVPKARDAAVERAVKMADSLDEEELRFLISQTKSVEAARVLLKRNPGDASLAFVERNVEQLRDTVESIRKKESTAEVLREIDRVL